MAVRRFAPKDLLRETFLTHLAVAPDGSSVVYGRRTMEEGAYKTRLWRVPTSGGRAEQITTGDSDFRPRFSPDGKTLAFLSMRSDKSQPWLLPLAGGEPPGRVPRSRRRRRMVAERRDDRSPRPNRRAALPRR